MKGWYKALEDLVWLTQLGLNMLLPLVMCLGGAWWAVNNWSWPEWVFLPAILLGLAAGAQNFWYFAKESVEACRIIQVVLSNLLMFGVHVLSIHLFNQF